MAQLVLVHGPGAGGNPDCYCHQLAEFSGALAPALPGHPDGAPCADVARYSAWLRGWLWARGHSQKLVLAGYTLGACIALQYALDYPGEVGGLLLMTVSMRPKAPRSAASLDLRRQAAVDPKVHEQWLNTMRVSMRMFDPALRERLIDNHRKVGPLAQLHDFHVIDAFDVRDRIEQLRAPLVLLRGGQDPLRTEHDNNYELEIHQKVPHSEYIELADSGHFPMAEQPQVVNPLLARLLAQAS